MMSILGTLSFLLLITQAMILPALADGASNKMRMSQYNEWSVILNYVDISNPRCQVDGAAGSPDREHSGIITIWRAYTMYQFADLVHVEVVVTNVETMKRVRLLFEEGVHQFGNESGTVDSITRASPILNPPVFLLDRDEFKKIISPPNESLTAIIHDRKGNEITIKAPLKGISDALDQCQIFR